MANACVPHVVRPQAQTIFGFPGGIGGLIARNDSTLGVQYYHFDDLGSVAGLTGTTTSDYNYDAFGNLLTAQASGDTNRYLFSTKEFDARAGLYYFSARYYDPTVGRFLTADPMGFVDGPNQYVFVHNNPVNFIDLMGLQTITEELVTTTVIVAGATAILSHLNRNGLNAGAGYPPLREVAGAPSLESLGYFPNFKFNRPPNSNSPKRNKLFKILAAIGAAGYLQKQFGIEEKTREDFENKVLNSNNSAGKEHSTTPSGSIPNIRGFINNLNLYRYPTVNFMSNRA